MRSFMDASGKAYDRTDNSPYPEGFKIEIEAVPETEEDSFTHWSAVYLDNLSAQGVTVQENSKNPSELFEDLESPKTKFEIPGRRVEIRPHFTTTNPLVDPGDFHYDHNDFGTEPSGGVGDTYHYWDISALEEGDKINFHFYAIYIPDRFRVFYGDIDNWEDNSLELIFDSGFVSYNPDSNQDSERYPDGVRYHDWHEQVEEETILTSYNSGVYESIIEKEANRDVVMINVQGRDDGTVWHYTVVEGN